jgi:AcrR family transcriptional regulator
MRLAKPPRERIMKEATRLLARGAQPSIESISNAAGVSRTTFFRVFGSRAGLIQALELEPEPETSERVVETALRLLQTSSLAGLSMDQLAAEAGISRANLYRLFPGKAALFRAILIAFSPFEPAMALLSNIGDRPPEEFIPELVRGAYRMVARRTGIVRTVLFEITSMTPETQQVFAETGLKAVGMLARYLQAQMDAGRLRRMHPMLAVQGLIGGVMMNRLAEPVFSNAMVQAPAGEEAVVELARLWLRGMRPEV